MVLSFLPVQGALLAYQCLGTGPFLLTIPGANGDASIFNEVAPYLAQDFTVCTYDRRGYSNSTLTTNALGDLTMPYRLQRDVDDAAALLSHVSGGDPVRVFGTSSGAIVALELLRRHADLVAFLIAHEPPLASVLGGTWAEETYSVFEGIHQTFLIDGIDAATSGFLGPGAANSTDVETRAAYHALADPAKRDNAELFYGHEIAAYTAVNVSMPEFVGLKDKFVMDIGENCNIPSCNISAILASKTGVDLYVTPGGHLGYVSEPEGFARKVIGIFSAHG
ncbi:abhydrolase [Diaporthe sp. PMI_573]|nr:abhydrolase [Diaporthaceae sp. PMI_573]